MFSRFFSRMQLLRCSGTSPGKGQPFLAALSPSHSHGDEGTRTPGFLLAKQALSQLSYVPASQVGLTRLEQVTSRLSGECSNQLSYRPAPLTTP